MAESNIEYFRQYRKKHRDEIKEYQSAYHKGFYNSIRKKRYRNDPEYRAKELERKRSERLKRTKATNKMDAVLEYGYY